MGSPCFFKFLNDAGGCDFLVAREIARRCPHVAGALNVVLAAKRIDAAAGTAVFAGHHGDVGERHHAFGARRVLGDA